MIWEEEIGDIDESDQIKGGEKDDCANAEGDLDVFDDGNGDEDNC